MRTHYDVLQVDRNCSEKEIKESFIKLSKKYHPDKNKSTDAHKKFVEVNEAYSVLGKPVSRRRYDATLSFETPRSTVNNTTHYQAHNQTKTAYEYYHDMYASNIRKHQEQSGYITRSKFATVCFCFFLMAIGSGLQMVALARRRRLQSHEIATRVKEANERRRQRRQMQQKHQQAVTENEAINMNPREY